MRIFVCAIAALMVGCGGGGGGDEAAAPEEILPLALPAATAKAVCLPVFGAPQVRVQLFGDSTMVGYAGGTGVLATVTPAKVLQSELDDEFGVGSTLVSMRAANGTTSAELIAGADGVNAPWPQSVAAEIVVINHGINDMGHLGDIEGYRARLRTLAVSGAVTVFETPNMLRAGPIGDYAQVMRDVAAETGSTVADTYAYTSTLRQWYAWIPDGVHPTSALYQAIGTYVLAPAVAAQVRKLVCQ